VKVELGKTVRRTGSGALFVGGLGPPSWLRLVAWGLWFWLPSVLAERGSESHVTRTISPSLYRGCSCGSVLCGAAIFRQHRDASQVDCAHCRGLASFTNRICDSVGGSFSLRSYFRMWPTFSTEFDMRRSCYEESQNPAGCRYWCACMACPAWASPQTVTLNVSGMTCPACQ